MLVSIETPGHPEFHLLDDLATVVRLGQGVDLNQNFHPDAMQRTIECLIRYSNRLKELGGLPQETVAVATSGSRDARNSVDFFKQVESQTGFRFRRISGEEEAKYTFLGGLLEGMDPQSTAVIDIGGGSTEFMSHQGGLSLNIGSVRFTERFLLSNPVTDQEFWNCQLAVDKAIQQSGLIDWREKNPQNLKLCAVAGTATTLASWFLELTPFHASKIDGLILSRGDLHRQVEDLKWRTVEERRALPGVEEGRADVLLAGALILWRSMELLNFTTITVSTRGLRYGVLRLPHLPK